MLVKHAQSNGQAELANRVILEGLKKWLGDAKCWWIEELPSVLWSYWMTPQIATNETPFKLMYGFEPMIPVKVGQHFNQCKLYNRGLNDEWQKEELDILLEIKE